MLCELLLLSQVAMADIPPQIIPPGWTPPPPAKRKRVIRPKVLHSPKFSEHLASLGKPMFLAPTGFRITNIVVSASGEVTLAWQQDQPCVQIQGSPDLSGTWTNIGGLIIGSTKTFTAGPNHFFRLQGNVGMTSSASYSNGTTTLTWQLPEITDMSDSLGNWSLHKYTGGGDPPNQAADDYTGWTPLSDANPISGGGGTTTKSESSTITGNPPFWLRLKQTTGNGRVIPQVPVKIRTSQPGNFQWVHGIGGRIADSVQVVSLAPDGGYVIGGKFSGTAFFDDAHSPAATLTTTVNAAIFLLKLDNNGNFQWVKGFDGPGGAGSIDIGTIVFATNGDIIMAGSSNLGAGGTAPSTINIGGSDITSNSSLIGFLGRYSSAGAHVWSFGIVNCKTQCNIYAACIDSQNRITLTGSWDTTGLIGDHSPNIIIQQPNRNGTPFQLYSKLMFFQVNGDGVVQWYKNTPESSRTDNIGYGLAADANNDLYLSCRVANHDFGGTNPRYTAAGALAKYSANGTWIFDKMVMNSGEGLRCALIQGTNQIVISGAFLSYGDDMGGGHMDCGGDNDMCFARYSTVDGSYIPNSQKHIVGSTGTQGRILSITASASSIAMCGYFYGTGYTWENTFLAPINQGSGWAARYGIDGSLKWVVRVGRTVVDYNSDACTSVIIDRQGNPVVGGGFAAVAVFGDKTLTSNKNINGDYTQDGFIGKIDP